MNICIFVVDTDKTKRYLRFLVKNRVHIVLKHSHDLQVWLNPWFNLPQGCPLVWGCRIHRLHLCRGLKKTSNDCPGNDTKTNNGEVPVMLELWEMRSTPLFLSLPDQLWSEVVVPHGIQSMGQIKLNCVLTLSWIIWNRTVFYIETA